MGETAIDLLWVSICAALVFFMQLGFMCLEVGNVRKKSISSVAVKNIADWVVVSIAFYLIGFGLMFGSSHEGLIGFGMFSVSEADFPEGQGANGMGFALFQMVFAATAATIVSGALAERIRFFNYIGIAFFMGLLIYPVFGHWVWGGALSGDETLLTRLGFIDFAGAAVVHMVGGAVALVGVVIVGPRIDRFDVHGKPKEFPLYSIPWAAMGVLILAIGWWGFNGGSSLKFDDSVLPTIFNTNLAACAGGASGFLFAYLFQKKEFIYEKLFGGILGGLVAITACCNVIGPPLGLLIGALAGIAHNLSYDFILKRMRLDDPVGAIPVHLTCGALGILCVGIFGDVSKFGGNTRLEQIGVQALGIVVCVVWCLIAGYAMFALMRKYIGLRVSPQAEREGIKIWQENLAPDVRITKEEMIEIKRLLSRRDKSPVSEPKEFQPRKR